MTTAHNYNPATGSGIVVVDGEPFTFDRSHPKHKEIIEKLKCSDLSGIKELLDIKLAFDNYAKGRVEIVGDQVLLDGKPVHNSVSTRILDLFRDGFPIEPMTKFLENLMDNPSSTSVKELYDFLEHKNIPVTEDGCFLAYKAVRPNYLDIYSGTINNSPGKVVTFKRNEVDDNRDRTCSYGLHVGAVDYVRHYGGPDSKILVVKVNPKDCVSVPLDHGATKLRVCKYEVLYEIERHKVLEDSLYSSSGESSREEVSKAEGLPSLEEVVQALDSLTRDALLNVCVNLELTETKREGKRLGKANMVDLCADHIYNACWDHGDLASFVDDYSW